jgi:hypothetical protein
MFLRRESCLPSACCMNSRAQMTMSRKDRKRLMSADKDDGQAIDMSGVR